MKTMLKAYVLISSAVGTYYLAKKLHKVVKDFIDEGDNVIETSCKESNCSSGYPSTEDECGVKWEEHTCLGGKKNYIEINTLN